MSPSSGVANGVVSASHIWKRYRADYTRSVLRETLSTIRHRHVRQGSWVLHDVDLHVEKGDSIGLIGLNGSGKSTLLKILAGVTLPNAGRLQVGGRIGALIEVRAGIHPELTGRENVFFYGTVLGLSRRQVADRFDDIVDFAELSDAIDRQVKFYSSGMAMRLGFAISAFLEPDVLLVDEALAVGDVGFQQRCLDRMKTVVDQGTTLFLVSHDMSAVEAMCKRTLWLDAGMTQAFGPTGEVMAQYRIGLEQKAARLSSVLSSPVHLTHLSATAIGGGAAETGQPLDVAIALQSDSDAEVDVCVGISEGTATPIFTLTRGFSLRKGDNDLRCVVENLPLPKGRYYVWIGAFGKRGERKMPWHPGAPLDVDGPLRQPPPRGVMLLSPVHITARWGDEALRSTEFEYSADGSARTAS